MATRFGPLYPSHLYKLIFIQECSGALESIVRPEMSASRELKELCNCLNLDNSTLQKVIKVFQHEMVSGLKNDNTDSSMKCFITYIHRLPKGDETGTFLSLHFASVVLRVSMICMKIGNFDLRAKQYVIPKNLVTAPGDQLFDYLAECIYEFTSAKRVNQNNLPLGFTFGFPLHQTGLKSGTSTGWVKEFKCPGVVGKDVVVLLEKAIAKIPDLKVEVAALINDTAGALLSCAWKRPACRIGVILDAGTNLCYVEKIKDVPKYKGPEKKMVLINTECGNLGANGCIDFMLTPWDLDVDKNTKNPGSNIFEKAISSRYLGELVRLVMVSAAQKSIMFKGRVSNTLATRDAFDPNFLILISQEPNTKAGQVLSNLGYDAQPQDIVNLRYVCETVWTRAAHLLAAAISAVVRHLHHKDVVVGFDGTFYRSHAALQILVENKIKELIEPQVKVRCQIVDDRGGLGAALAASIASSTRDEVGDLDEDGDWDIRQSRISELDVELTDSISGGRASPPRASRADKSRKSKVVKIKGPTPKAHADTMDNESDLERKKSVRLSKKIEEKDVPLAVRPSVRMDVRASTRPSMRKDLPASARPSVKKDVSPSARPSVRKEQNSPGATNHNEAKRATTTKADFTGTSIASKESGTSHHSDNKSNPKKARDSDIPIERSHSKSKEADPSSKTDRHEAKSFSETAARKSTRK